jgi:hypothetical protein
MLTDAHHLFLRAALAVTGLATIAVGLDNALGGIDTLGWQGPTGFAVALDPGAFAVRDSHVRFLGAVWGGAGVVFLAASLWLAPLRQAVAVLAALAALGGLARFSSMGPREMLDAGLGLPLAIELVVFPALAIAALRVREQATGLRLSPSR